MPRTTAGAVRSILGEGEDGYQYDSETEPSLTSFIETASAITDDVQACAVAKGGGHTAARLELIERWLAAHFYCVMDPTYQERWTGKAKGIYQGRSGMYLDSTRYGQHAQILDGTGCLAALGNSKRVRLAWLGKRPSEQLPYWQRD